MDKIVITADLGHFRAYMMTKSPEGTPRVDLIENYDSIEGHGKLGGKLSDSAGRFASTGTPKVFGEAHNLELEIQKQLARMIAEDINFLIQEKDHTAWCLAAPEKINSIIINNLKPDVKTALIKNIMADLTTVKQADIPGHFS